MRRLLSCVFVLALVGGCAPGGGLQFAIRFESGVQPEAVDGRIILIIAATDTPEPRFQVTPSNEKAPALIGVNR